MLYVVDDSNNDENIKGKNESNIASDVNDDSLRVLSHRTKQMCLKMSDQPDRR